MTGELDLQPGLTYRSTIKLCADDICFPVSHSDGVVILPNKPVTGSLEVQLDGLKVFRLMWYRVFYYNGHSRHWPFWITFASHLVFMGITGSH